MTYTMCKKLITRGLANGTLNKDDMLSKLDVFLLNDRITEAEYNELVDLMETAATK